MEGYLFKQGEKGLVKSWRRRWFLMDDEKMFYFKDKGEPVVGFINLNQAGTVTVNDRTHARDGYGFQVLFSTKTQIIIYICALLLLFYVIRSPRPKSFINGLVYRSKPTNEYGIYQHHPYLSVKVG
jgi:hypothetical protein